MYVFVAATRRYRTTSLGGVADEGSPLEVFVAAVPGQKIKAVDQPRRPVFRGGPEESPRAVHADLATSEWLVVTRFFLVWSSDVRSERRAV